MTAEAHAPAWGHSDSTTRGFSTVVSPNATRTNLQGQFNALLSQIDQLAKDSSYNGVNLLNGDNLKVTFNENANTVCCTSTPSPGVRPGAAVRRFGLMSL